MSKYEPLTIITYVFSFGMIFVLLYPSTLVELSNTQFNHIPFDAWLKIIYIIVDTFLTYLLTLYGLKFLSASTSSSIYTHSQLW